MTTPRITIASASFGFIVKLIIVLPEVSNNATINAIKGNSSQFIYLKLEVKNKEQRTKNKEQRTKNKEQRTKNKEQRTKILTFSNFQIFKLAHLHHYLLPIQNINPAPAISRNTPV